MNIEIELNGDQEVLTISEDDDLATALRNASCAGVKCGCDGGDCGASKVLIDGEAKMACGMAASEAAGSSIETIENLGTQDDLHPIQQSFVDHFAVQCGFCIPGMIMESKSLLAENPDPSEQEVREAIDDNICRCTGYQKPVAAILDAADRLNSNGRVATDGGITERSSVSSRTARDEVPRAGRSEAPRATGRRPVTAGLRPATQSGDCDLTGDSNE